MATEDVSINLSALRTDGDVDHTLQNLLQALTLNLELRARYRVFEFEARQDGLDECAQLFNELRRVESQQIADLLAGLRQRLAESEPAGDA
jgi:rubrerythrin